MNTLFTHTPLKKTCGKLTLEATGDSYVCILGGDVEKELREAVGPERGAVDPATKDGTAEKRKRSPKPEKQQQAGGVAKEELPAQVSDVAENNNNQMFFGGKVVGRLPSPLLVASCFFVVVLSTEKWARRVKNDDG